MCLLTFFPDSVVPDQQAIEGLHRGAEYNSDGFGYAIVTEGQILVQKGMNADKVIDQFTIDRMTFPEGPALFHSRIGTGGLVDESNCHPFYIGKDQKTVLAHNGILPELAQPAEKHDPRSDTRILAEDLLAEKPFGFFHSQLARDAFERWLGAYNKVVILTANPRYPYSSLMFNQDKGHWYHDSWWSNDSYLPYYNTKKYTGAYVIGEYSYVTDKADEKADRTCPVCGQENAVDPDYRVCWSCSSCVDCLSDWGKGECLCYIKSRGAITEHLDQLKDCTTCGKSQFKCTCEDL